MNFGGEKQNWDHYNKYLRSGPGTLVANWWEERELRDNTGIARTNANQHTAKKHQDLFTKSPEELPKPEQIARGRDNTDERTLGQKAGARFHSVNSEYGRTKNAADFLPKTGKKYEMLEKLVSRAPSRAVLSNCCVVLESDKWRADGSSIGNEEKGRSKTF
jgi:hypothetical protein